MDESTFQAWSEALTAIRDQRHSNLNNLHRERGSKYTVKDFVEVATSSLREAVDQWWNFESRSTESEDPAVVTEEMISIVDFEVDAITRELDSFEGAAVWDPKKIKEELAVLEKNSDEVKRSYTLKIRSAFGDGPTETPEPFSPLQPSAPFPPPPVSRPQVAQSPRYAGSTRSRGSGAALLLMFLLGLLLGSGPSFYFWDIAQKSQASNQDATARLSSEKRALEDNLGIYQQNLSQLASGKMKTLPQLEQAMDPIREDIEIRRKKVERDFNTKKESLIRRTPSGDLQDRALKTLQRNRDEALAALEAEEKTRLEPYLKQAQVLKELSAR